MRIIVQKRPIRQLSILSAPARHPVDHDADDSEQAFFRVIDTNQSFKFLCATVIGMTSLG
jgi:hypothetical protein